MLVYYAVSACFVLMFMMSPHFDNLNIVMKIAVLFIYATLFLSSVFCDLTTQDTIAKLEREVEELKANSSK